MHRVLADTINRLIDASSLDGLYEILERVTRDLGFDYFAIGHHVNLQGPPVDALGLSNYPSDWAEVALTQGYYLNDPVHRASIHTATGFRWSDLRSMIRLFPRDEEILERARIFGLSDGYTVPVHVPGEYRGTCSFGARAHSNIRPETLALATTIGAYAFEAGRKITRATWLNPGLVANVPLLTDRQRDTLVLIARGKPDPEIADALGIATRTAHHHVENVRRAYGNAQRPFLIARALFDGQISFGDVFRK